MSSSNNSSRKKSLKIGDTNASSRNKSLKKGHTNAVGQKSGKRVFIFWIFLSILLVFVSNIFMHLFSRGPKAQEFQLKNSLNCQITDEGQYVPINDDPQLFYSREDASRELSGLRIDFGKPVENEFVLELYYPDEQGTYSEERTVKDLVPAGSEYRVIHMEPGQYSEIRLDLNASVYVKGVYEGDIQPFIIYANKVWRYQVWGICLLVALVLSVLFYRNEKKWRRWEEIYQQGMSFVSNTYHSIEIRKMFVILFVGTLLGFLIEGAIVLFAHKSFNSMETAVIWMISILVLSFVFFREAYKKRLEIVFFTIFMCCGVVFLYVTPVSLGIAWDDQIHYNNAVSLARISSKKITSTDWVMVFKFSGGCLGKEGYQRENRKIDEKQYDENYREGMIADMNYGFSYKDISYLPFVLGIWVAYGFGLSFCATMIFGRLFNLLFIGIILYYSMKNIKSGKMLVPAFAMIPTVFFLITSYSYDTWLSFLLLYAFCRYFGELQKKDEILTFSRFLGIYIPAFLALLPKIVYAPMLFLMAYMPKEKFKEKKWCTAYRACFCFAVLLMICGIIYVASGRLTLGVGDVRGGADVNSDMQLKYITHNFGTYCGILADGMRRYLSYEFSAQYLTFMAYMGITNLPNMVVNMQYIPIGLLIFTALWDRASLDRKTIPVCSKVVAVIMPVIIVAICATAMYISFTPVALNVINGYQGRYLLPAIFPSLYMISRCGILTGIRKKIPVEMVNMALIGISVCFLMYNLWVNCAVKY